jgi:hypothetical protein
VQRFAAMRLPSSRVLWEFNAAKRAPELKMLVAKDRRKAAFSFVHP